VGGVRPLARLRTAVPVPTRSGVVVPALAVGTATLALAHTGEPSLIVALGLPLLVASVRKTGPLQAHLGGLVMVAGLLLAGAGPVDDGLLLVATVGVVVAWDAATTATTLDRQVSPAAETTRAEVVHSGATFGVGTVVAALAYGLSRITADVTTTTVAILVVVGAVALLVVLDPRGS
jgi:hypothetical protein